MSKGGAVPVVELPWGAWHRDGLHRLPLPDHWSVDVLRPNEVPRCPPGAIADALDAPVGAPSLGELAARSRSVCIVVDDLARPTLAAVILPALLDRLHQANIPHEAINIVVATGSHGVLHADEMALKVGRDIAARYPISSHDCRGDLAPTGILYGDKELRVNREFHRAELKIAVGSILPHPFAGYSGGAKLVIPGLVDLDAVARSHKFVQLGLRGGTDPNQNRFRTEAEQLACQLGLTFAVCVVSNERREPVYVLAGDPVAAHRAACHSAAAVFHTGARRRYDCVVVNAYPKDIDLIQSESALLPLKATLRDFVEEQGVVVLTTAASHGVGRHGLFEPGGVSYQSPRKRLGMGNRELWIYTPTIPSTDVHQLYWDGYPVHRDAGALCDALAARFPKPAAAAVLPVAPMQQLSLAAGVDVAPQRGVAT